jgi:hypothetical protein
MMRGAGLRYNGGVIGTWGRGAAAALFASSCFFLAAGAARADDQYAVGPSPVVRVILTSGKLLVQAWNGSQVSIGTSGTLNVRHLAATDPRARVQPQILMPAQTAYGPQGAVPVTREMFVMPRLPAGPHDALVVRGQGDTTIYVPRGTAMIFARVRSGNVTIADYSGAFVTHVRNGDVYLQHVSGTGYAQSLEGQIVADDSTFARLRARTVLGNMLFRGCVSNQIEATSTYGSIVYDNGQFQPGLARFESQYGNVALGVQNGGGGVQIGAHSGSGRIVSNFADGTQVTGSANDTEARVRGGGPVVTTSTQNGSVYLYNGSMTSHPMVQQNLMQANGPLPVTPYYPAAAPGYAPAVRAPARVQTQGARVQWQQQQHPRSYPAPQASPKKRKPQRPPQPSF